MIIIVLATLTAVAPLATDMYVPGLPDLGRSLGARMSSAQLSLTTFLIGVVAGQLLLGPLSDAVGRRGVLVWGSAAFTICSAVCALSPTIEILNAARLCQGIAGAAGIVVARAVITDLFQGDTAAKKFSTLAAIGSAAPILAPMLGGVVLSISSWRAVFGVLAAVGLMLVGGVLLWVPESLPRSRRNKGGPVATVKVIGVLLRRRRLMGQVLSLCFGCAGVFTYLAGSSFVFQEVYGASTGLTSLIYGVNAVGSMAGSFLFGRLVRRFAVEILLLAGITSGLVAICALATSLIFSAGSLALTWSCLFIFIFAFGLYFPAVMTSAQELGRDAPGATSALLGGGQFLLGGVTSPLVGAFGTESALPMAAIIATCLGLGSLAAASARMPSTSEKER
ncbi:multidrug effflux MFS transporter [Amycolatopsis sp. NPDC052450]|uniref:multidrug effflux MFS transporter n=1 Tax=Amycolatopsis sp. NPDC052450 TaxID=3363937 RepID=UPI0037CC4822